MRTSHHNFSFAVFPFLKTSSKVSIGQLTFQSTDDTDGLSAQQAACINEIANMLFLKDNLRIKSASYAVVPFIDLNHTPVDIDYLLNIQAFVAYCYSSPRHEFGDIFLSSEHASMAIFTPGLVSIYLVHPTFHVDVVGPALDLEANKHGYVEGYDGLYNFRHHFWVAKGSRLYGPKPDLTLNHSQDMCFDLARAATARVDYRLLSELLKKPDTQTSSRVFTAVRWFNAANNEANDEATAIVNLSIAFETLLGLPIREKTDRLIDAISLLLGRIPRLDIWAGQFYGARSQIVHEGVAQQFSFVVKDPPTVSEAQQYQSLLSYGRQIFQLCLGTLLVGTELAENANLEDNLITNQERFNKICKVLADETIGPRERLESIAPIIAAIQKYQYVQEPGLKIETLICATKYAAKTLLEQDELISNELKKQLEQLSNANRTKYHFGELEALRSIESIFTNESISAEMTSTEIVQQLVKAVWSYVFRYYFWIKEYHPENA